MLRAVDPARRGSSGEGAAGGGAGRRSVLRDSSGRALKRLDLDAAFFWLILVFLLTVVAFFSLRPAHVALDAGQLAEYERRTQFLANSTVYVVEAGRAEGLLSRLPAGNWAQISAGIDFVAFVYDDLQLFLSDAWVDRAEAALRAPRAQSAAAARAAAGIGIALFPCGCVLPNEYFVRVPQRLAGHECTLLPGWVLDGRDVHWLDVPDPSAKRCKRRAHALDVRAARLHAASLQSIRKTIVQISDALANRTAVAVDAVAGSAKMMQQKVAAAPAER